MTPQPPSRAPASPSAGEDGDAALLLDIGAGDASATETLVRRHYGRLLAVTRRILLDERDAREAVQAALVDALRSIDPCDGSGLSAWLRRHAIRAALGRLRADAPQAEDPIEPLLPRFTEDGEHADHVPAWPLPAEAGPFDAEMREQMRAAVARLPGSYRVVFVLRDVEELDPEETADLLGLPPDLVKERLHRARQALRTVLTDAVAH